MNILDYITGDTEIVLANDISFNVANVPGEKSIYHKSFNINDMIVGELAKLRKLNANQYLFLLLDSSCGKFQYRDISKKRKINDSEIRIGSYNFCCDDVQYFECPTETDFFDIVSWCPNEKNKQELINEILELFALDVYTWEEDRFTYNIIFEKRRDGEIHLSKIFDFGESLNTQLFPNGFAYYNALYDFEKKEDYSKFMDLYPQFREYLKFYQSVDLIKEMERIFEERKLNIEKFPIDQYKRFEEESQKLLYKILC